MKLSQVIRAYRKEAGLTQEEVAEKTGLTRQYISALETEGGEKAEGATLVTVRKITNLLGIPTFLVGICVKGGGELEAKHETLGEILDLDRNIRDQIQFVSTRVDNEPITLKQFLTVFSLIAK